MILDDFNLSAADRVGLNAYCRNGTFPQTLLIEGAEPSVRTAFARLIANMIVCDSSDEKPCGRCSACIKCAANSHPDIMEYGEEDSEHTFKVELSREIRQDAFVIPNDGDNKVYIIKEAQNMNEASENALLKILEEPPRFDFFVLTCQSKSAMLDTILSRATVLSLGAAKTEFSDSEIDIASKLLKSLCADSELAIVENAALLSSAKDSFLKVTCCMKQMALDSLKYKQTGKNETEFPEVTALLCNKLTAGRIYDIITALGGLETLFRQNANYNLLLTSMCVKLRRAAGK